MILEEVMQIDVIIVIPSSNLLYQISFGVCYTQRPSRVCNYQTNEKYFRGRQKLRNRIQIFQILAGPQFLSFPLAL